MLHVYVLLNSGSCTTRGTSWPKSMENGGVEARTCRRARSTRSLLPARQLDTQPVSHVRQVCTWIALLGLKRRFSQVADILNMRNRHTPVFLMGTDIGRMLDQIATSLVHQACMCFCWPCFLLLSGPWDSVGSNSSDAGPGRSSLRRGHCRESSWTNGQDECAAGGHRCWSPNVSLAMHVGSGCSCDGFQSFHVSLSSVEHGRPAEPLGTLPQEERSETVCESWFLLQRFCAI